MKMQLRLFKRNFPRRHYERRWLSNAGLLRLLLWSAAVLLSLQTLAPGKAVEEGRRTYRLSTPEKPEVCAKIVDIVEAFIAAGEKDDPTARGQYLAPKVFYYGHVRTREQAI